MSTLIKLKTLSKLGVLNIFRVALYKASLKNKFGKLRKLKADYLDGDFFRLQAVEKVSPDALAYDGWLNKRTYYSHHIVEEAGIPNWHEHPFTGEQSLRSNSPWWTIPDFDPEVGDIKALWESSRFDWVLCFAQQGVSDKSELSKLNTWLQDWCDSNQPYLGVNWKCGQEASIRVIHLALAALILEQFDKPEPALVRLIEVHLKRIEPSIGYAIAQNNNHGTSEAAALYIGGAWLESVGVTEAKRYRNLGQKWLVDRADKLILKDGTFSQYSVNYHRVMLDAYSVVELVRRRLDLRKFHIRLYSKLSLATEWLFQFVVGSNGQPPNLGANDGAQLLLLGAANYRDFRPSVQLASVLFDDQQAYKGEGPWNDYLHWLLLDIPSTARQPVDQKSMQQGGYELLRNPSAFVMFNLPVYQFRPCQSDALHLDLWLGGENILNDGGTYSYNCDPEVQSYFCGVESHNTIQFDSRDQMPKLSRFLYGEWLETNNWLRYQRDNKEIVEASYIDFKGAVHRRSIALGIDNMVVTDTVSGFIDSAVLRWRLPNEEIEIDKKAFQLSTKKVKIFIESDEPFKRFELVKGEESLFYQYKSDVPVMEVEVRQPCVIKTIFEF